MITRYLNRLIGRWLLSLSKELIKEAYSLKDMGRYSESIVLASLASAVVRMSGEPK